MRDFGIFGRNAFELYEAESRGDTRQEQPNHIHWVRTALIPYCRCHNRFVRL